MQILLLLLIENHEKRKFYVIDFVSNMASDHTSAGRFMLEAVHVCNDLLSVSVIQMVGFGNVLRTDLRTHCENTYIQIY